MLECQMNEIRTVDNACAGCPQGFVRQPGTNTCTDVQLTIVVPTSDPVEPDLNAPLVTSNCQDHQVTTIDG